MFLFLVGNNLSLFPKVLEANAIGYHTLMHCSKVAPSPIFEASHVILAGNFGSKILSVWHSVISYFETLTCKIL